MISTDDFSPRNFKRPLMMGRGRRHKYASPASGATIAAAAIPTKAKFLLDMRVGGVTIDDTRFIATTLSQRRAGVNEKTALCGDAV
jgi:hypothetical protein